MFIIPEGNALVRPIDRKAMINKIGAKVARLIDAETLVERNNAYKDLFVDSLTKEEEVKSYSISNLGGPNEILTTTDRLTQVSRPFRDILREEWGSTAPKPATVAEVHRTDQQL